MVEIRDMQGLCLGWRLYTSRRQVQGCSQGTTLSASDLHNARAPIRNGTLIRYVKLRVAHAPGMPGTFSPPPRVSDHDIHHGTCVKHVPWCMSGSLTSGFLWSRWQGKRSRHLRRMRNPQFYVSGKSPMPELCACSITSEDICWLGLSPKRKYVNR